jgi:hypothetical protein
MTSNNKKKNLITVIALGALAVAVAFGAVAYHSATASAPTAAASANTSALPMGKGGMRGGGYTEEQLAAALGITTDELTAAYQAAREAAIQQALDQGLITQAQADQLKANSGDHPAGGRWDGWLAQNGIDYDALLAEALGITVDELQTAYTQAFNAAIDQAVTDGKLTQEQAELQKGQRALYADEKFQASMQSAYEVAVKQAVSDGVITQAQADLILANQTEAGPGGGHDFGGLPGTGPMDGGRGGGPHGRGGVPGDNAPNQGGAPVNPNAPVTPDAQS